MGEWDSAPEPVISYLNPANAFVPPDDPDIAASIAAQVHAAAVANPAHAPQALFVLHVLHANGYDTSAQVADLNPDYRLPAIEPRPRPAPVPPAAPYRPATPVDAPSHPGGLEETALVQPGVTVRAARALDPANAFVSPNDPAVASALAREVRDAAVADPAHKPGALFVLHVLRANGHDVSAEIAEVDR